MLDRTWSYGVTHTVQPQHQPIVDLIYWPVLVTYNKWNIINFKNKYTYIEYFDDIFRFFLEGIIEYMVSIVKIGNYFIVSKIY